MSLERSPGDRLHAWRGACLALALAVGVSGCATNPVTGQRQLALVSEAQEVEIGKASAQGLVQQMGLVQDGELQAYVEQIGRKLAATSERPELPWSFAVLDDPTPNALAAPGGFIFVTRGLLTLMNSEAELATVLGHEIGHVTARHSVQQISRAQLAQLGLGLGMILYPQMQGLGDLAGAGLQLMMLKYGRDAERQADELGFNYALQHDYDVREMANTFRALQRSGEVAGRSPMPNWASSHPAEAERIAAVEARAAKLAPQQGTPRTGRDEFMQRISGLVYGDNPRNGYFRSGAYYHPEMRFQFRVPQDWRTQNTAQAVLAVSQKQDAALQLTLVPGGLQPDQAAQRFLAQEGIQGRSSRQTFNGIPAVVNLFQAQAQQGVVQGYAAFLRHGDQTFQLVTYSPAPAFAGYDRLFQQILQSFAPLTDRRLLDVQPQRIETVRVPSNMTLAEFARRYEVRAPIEQLAVINQVDGANAQLRAGTWAKRIVGAPVGD